MKPIFFLAPFLLMSVCKENCRQKKQNNTSSNGEPRFHGRLEVKGGCMNYTIAMLGSRVDTNLVVANWKDEATGKSHRNVFALNSRCTFPGTIEEGDEFDFVIDSTTVQHCAVCMMYYPVPAKKLSIKVLQH